MLGSFLLYGIPNIAGAIIGAIFLAIFIPRYRKKETRKERLKPLIYMYVALMIAEVLKISFHVSTQGFFSPQTFPIIYCSFVMYTIPLICHAKLDSKAFRIACGITIVSCLAIGAPYFFVYPGIDPNDLPTYYTYIMHYHSRIYHIMMLTTAIYLVVVNVYDFRFKDFILCAGIVSLYFGFCTTLSVLIGANISIFGPGSQYFQVIYNRFGYGVGNLLLCAIVYLAGFFVWGSIKLIRDAVIKRQSRQIQSTT